MSPQTFGHSKNYGQGEAVISRLLRIATYFDQDSKVEPWCNRLQDDTLPSTLQWMDLDPGPSV
jgi:hypothetical protein